VSAITGLIVHREAGRRLFIIALSLGITGSAFVAGLVAAAAPVLIAGAALALVMAAISLVRPSTATYVVVAILYSNAAAVAISHHGLPAFIGLAFPALLAIPLADYLVFKRQPVTFTSAFPFLAGYFVVVLISAAASSNPSATLDSVLNFLIGGIALYFVVTNVVRSFATLNKIIWIVLLVAAALSALSLFQAMTGTYNTNYVGFAQTNVELGVGDFREGEGTPRHAGPIGEKNRYAQILLVLVPIGALFALGRPTRWSRWVALLLTALILFGMVSTFSRGAAFGLVAVLVVAAFLRYFKPVQLMAVGVALVVALVAFPGYGERLEGLQAITRLDRGAAVSTPVEGDDANLRSRATAALAATFAFADNPLTGLGPGQFAVNFQRYAAKVAAAAFDTRIKPEDRQAHNLYAGVGAELGLLGLLFFLGVFAVTMRDLYRVRRRWLRERPEVAHLATGFLLALIAYLVSGMALHLAFERYLWFLLALAGITAHLASRSPSLPIPSERSISIQPVGVAEDSAEAGRFGRQG
jgi:putative inorganic carbon (hco3(-)) transporter